MIPWSSRAGALSLTELKLAGVAGSSDAQALFAGRDRKHTYTAQISLAYTAGAWRVVDLVPPDLDVVLAPPPAPPLTPTAVRSAAAAFALAYADYVEGATRALPAGLPSIRGQITGGQDPLAGTAPTHVPAQLTKLEFAPVQGNVVGVTAVLSDAGRRLSATFDLERTGGRWHAWWFPEGATG